MTTSSAYSGAVFILKLIRIGYTFFLCVWLNLIISSCPALVDSSCWFKALRWRQQCTRKSGSTLDLVQKHHFTTGTGTRRNLDIILLENKDNWKMGFCCPSRIWQQVAKTRNCQNISFFFLRFGRKGTLCQISWRKQILMCFSQLWTNLFSWTERQPFLGLANLEVSLSCFWIDGISPPCWYL